MTWITERLEDLLIRIAHYNPVRIGSAPIRQRQGDLRHRADQRLMASALLPCVTVKPRARRALAN